MAGRAGATIKEITIMGEALRAVEGFFGLFEAGDLAAAEGCFADGCVNVTPAGSMDRDQHLAFGRMFKDGLPDARMEIVNVVESGPEVVVEGRFRGTHSGDLVTPQGSIPASGGELDLPFADYFRVEGGKIVEHRTYWDQGTMMAQLGAGGRP
jgi:ketosteroid isomerase-like protein